MEKIAAPASLQPSEPARGGLLKAFGLPELFRWCLPALLVGALLRILLTFDMPLAYVQYDTSDFLTTTRAFLTNHSLHIHSKRSYLTPVLFSLAFALPVPALYTIPAAQHAMGLLGILVTGGIVRMWFKHWKWFIVPATLLMGASPMIIWYEHSLLGEAQYMFFALAAALAASAWFKRPSPLTFGLFMASLVLVTGTRLEGKLLFLTALALIPFVYWGQWKSLFRHGALAVALMAFGFAASGGRDGSPLLLASVLQLAPDHFKSAPDFAPSIIPLRDNLRSHSDGYPDDLVAASKKLSHAAEDYLDKTSEKKLTAEQRKKAVGKLLRGVCLETLKASPLEVMKLPFIKFQLAIDAWSAYCWNDLYLHQRQWEAFTREPWMSEVLSKGLTGQKQTPEELRPYVDSHYNARRVQWFTDYQARWNDAWIALSTPDFPLNHERWVHDFVGGVPGGEKMMPGIPYFYPIALAGLLAAILRWRRLGCLHLMWGGCLLSIMYIALMVGVTNGRFRFAYEPFILFDLLLFFDCLADALLSHLPSNHLKPASITV